MELSKYQRAIVEWVKSGKGHACCNAVAGSGKTTTLRLAATALTEAGLSPSDVRVIVFGKANSQDLINKFGQRWKGSISTLHSAGFNILIDVLNLNRKRVKVDDRKYRKIAEGKGYIDRRGGYKGDLTRFEALAKDSDFIRIMNLIRLTNQEPRTEVVKNICDHFEIADVWEYGVVASAAADCLEAGEREAQRKDRFDFTDQIWLPVKWRLSDRGGFKSYRFVLVDECQDLNAAQLELVLMLAGETGRMLFVGDPRQAIYGFAGADCDSYQKILERVAGTELPLSICYRCPKSHIALVKKIFPEIPIEAHPDAEEGSIAQIKEENIDQHLRTGDLVLSRKTAPLVSLCIKLIAQGIPATVKGKSIAEQLKAELEEIGKMSGFEYDRFNEFLESYRGAKIERYKGLDNEEQLTDTLNDKLLAIATIYRSQPNRHSIEDLGIYIDSLFSEQESPVTLCTCHRAKGLEHDRIFIIKPGDMPLVWQKQALWQSIQEDNLLYVALTRSKSELFIVGEAEWYKPDKIEAQPETEWKIKPEPRSKLEPEPKPQHQQLEIFALFVDQETAAEEVEEVTTIDESEPADKPQSAWAIENHNKREKVTAILRDPDWRDRSDRAIAEYCGVSNRFVGMMRKRLDLEVGERVDKNGRKLTTENIGSTKPKKSARDKIAAIVSNLDKEEILRLSDWLRILAEDM